MKWISKYQKTGKLNFKTTGLPWQQSYRIIVYRYTKNVA